MTRPMQLGGLQYAIIGLALITALIHFSLLFPDVVFILNGLGYLAFVTALYFLPAPFAKQGNKLRWAFIAYTAITVVLWLFFGARNNLAYFDKAVEGLLIILLWLESQRPH